MTKITRNLIIEIKKALIEIYNFIFMLKFESSIFSYRVLVFLDTLGFGSSGGNTATELL